MFFSNVSITSTIYEPFTVWKVSKYGVFSGPYFSVFGPNAGKYGPEKTPYMDAFHAVISKKDSLIRQEISTSTE